MIFGNVNICLVKWNKLKILNYIGISIDKDEFWV